MSHPARHWQVDLAGLHRAVQAWGVQLTALQLKHLWVNLEGDLGAGKTTLMQQLIGALGVPGRIKSPTYPLVETYTLPWTELHHMDWYRLQDVRELDALGVREWLGHAWVFVEWASRFPSVSQHADLTLCLHGSGSHRRIDFTPHTELGVRICPQTNA